MEECVFCKIVRGEISAEVVYQDNKIIGFKDISPKAPVHYVFIPKAHVDDLLDADDKTVMLIIKKILEKVRELGLKNKGYRVIINGGTAKAVPHLHVHLLGEVKIERQV